MEHIINQLVEIDSAGQAMVKQAQDAQEAERARMNEYKQAMYQDFLEKQHHRVDQYRVFEMEELERGIQELQKAHAQRLVQLRAAYDQHADEWVAGMVQRCTGG